MLNVTLSNAFQKYEEEKTENDRLRKELEETKKQLLEAKAELDRVMKQKDAARNSDRVCVCFLCAILFLFISVISC